MPHSCSVSFAEVQAQSLKIWCIIFGSAPVARRLLLSGPLGDCGVRWQGGLKACLKKQIAFRYFFNINSPAIQIVCILTVLGTKHLCPKSMKVEVLETKMVSTTWVQLKKKNAVKACKCYVKRIFIPDSCHPLASP